MARLYISPSGLNTNAGSIDAPKRNLYDISLIANPGDTIDVAAGNYNEMFKTQLKEGVSIEGAGRDITTITSLYAGGEILLLYSGGFQSGYNTQGNQTISGLRFDGDNLNAPMCMLIQKRGGVTVRDCSFYNFFESGVTFRGAETYGDVDFSVVTHGLSHSGLFPRVTYASGNNFHDNIMLNCAKHDNTYAWGSLQIGAQTNMLIYNNDIRNNTRGSQLDGEPIKLDPAILGHVDRTKIYNNVLKAGTKNPLVFDNSRFDFAIELFYPREVEIYGNDIEGSIDANWNYKIDNYSLNIHDNIISVSTLPTDGTYSGIVLEFDTEDCIVKNNKINGVSQGVFFSTRNNCVLRNIEIDNNLITNIGIPPAAYPGGQAVTSAPGATGIVVDNFKVTHNTIVGTLQANQTNIQYGVCLFGVASANNIKIDDNIIQGVGQDQSFYISPVANITNSSFRNNCLYGNVYNHLFEKWDGVATLPAGNVKSGNFEGTQNPNLDANYVVQNPALINAGTDGKTIGYNPVNTNRPTVNSGTDISITPPVTIANLSGTAIGNNGATITSVLWTRVSGANSTVIAQPNSLTTSVSGLNSGMYVFRLTATDSNGLSASDDVIVTVNNIPSNIKVRRRFKLI